jgi:hypothetical protein
MLVAAQESSSAGDSSDPLQNTGVLQNVLSYVGPGHCVFVAPVSKLWLRLYNKVESQQLTVEDEYEDYTVTCGPKMTLLSSVFESVSRVRLAYWYLHFTTKTFQLAAGKYADVATLKEAHSLGMKYTKATMTGAVKCNKLAEVQFLHSQGCRWPSYMLEEAASDGHYELVRFCSQNGCHWLDPSLAPSFAAQSGSIALMAYLMQQPESIAGLDAVVLRVAAFKGHRPLCEFLRALLCPWDETVTRQAAAGGQLDTLRWLIDSGCPWTADGLRAAAGESGNIEVLSYLQQQGLLTRTEHLTDALEFAGGHGQLAAAQWLRAQGADWPTGSVCSMWLGDVLEWATANGFTMPANAHEFGFFGKNISQHLIIT